MRPLSVASLLVLAPFAFADWCNSGWGMEPDPCTEDLPNVYCCSDDYSSGVFDIWRDAYLPEGGWQFGCEWQNQLGVVKCAA
ncbi:hypothetical protein CERZMDRAFT_98699 [Cercospora zeae-maydis SCOH1-5]|uniref:Hydrophobin n=1 Tax=Cercospora zeae-maydis SCOH1-5 TaxID=717836 RepID=A0A6A6FDH0_9PEZI|nr:hypothetical protein CERZMDRAFT_98699 [Cercospora zeae-maydis SCOH1-5]